MLLNLNYCSTLPKCSTCTCNLRTHIPASCCPICLHEKVSEKEVMKYLLCQMGVSSVREAAEKLQKQYVTREDFLKAMGG